VSSPIFVHVSTGWVDQMRQITPKESFENGSSLPTTGQRRLTFHLPKMALPSTVFSLVCEDLLRNAPNAAR